VDLCPQLGITLMNTAIGGHYSENEDKAAFMGHIHELADYAAERGVLISLEVHGDIMATGQISIPLMEEIGRPNVGINYDTANCVFYGGVEACDDIRPVVSLLKHIHLKDKRGGARVWDFPAVGEGHVNFWGLFKILEGENYTAPFSVEIEFSGLPWPALEEVHRSMKVSYQTLSELGLK
jgi:L-ribulose-5-phosphate 3-epimerase